MPAQAYLNNKPPLKELRDPTEEPYAVIPHVGICEGASRQRLVLP